MIISLSKIKYLVKKKAQTRPKSQSNNYRENIKQETSMSFIQLSSDHIKNNKRY